MKKKLLLFLSLLLACGLFIGCAAKTEEEVKPEQALETDFRMEQCGLAYSIPSVWLERDHVNLLPETYVDLTGEIYAKIQYDFVPDTNLAALDDVNSQISAEELMYPLVSMLVVREENLESEKVTAEMALFDTIEELPTQEGFRFYYLTEYQGKTQPLEEEDQKLFEQLKEELPLLRNSIETFLPDEAAVQQRLDFDKQYLNFMSTTLDGKDITSTIFYDYDLTVVNFWASYCYPDINELNELEAFYQNLQQEYPNVNFLQVIIDAPGEQAEKLVAEAYQEANVSFTGLMPDKNMAGWIIENIKGLPTTIFVDNTGKPMEQRIEGKQTPEYYMETTKKMLEEKTLPVEEGE